MNKSDKSLANWIISLVAIIFGIMTLKSGYTTLFVAGAKAAAGEVVLFVLWINFIMGFAYTGAGIGVLMGKPWAKNLSIGIAVITLLTYAAFGLNITLGGIWKMKTVKAMAVRTAVWLGIAYYTVSLEKRTNQNKKVGN